MDKILLWPDGAPGAVDDTEEDKPGITPYIIDNQVKRSAIIVCPGGGYCVKAPHEGQPIALWLNKIGINAFVLDYRVAPYKHPYPLMDVRRAVRYVRFNADKWNIDADKIGILGFSAGGHLAASAGTHFDYGDDGASDRIDRISCRPNAMVLAYPVITLGRFTHEGSMVNLLGENPPQYLKDELSNELHVNHDTPPAFLWHTADDEAVPVYNSLVFASELSKHGIAFELHVYESGVHGLGLAQDNEHINTWTSLCEKWLKRQGF